jgi:putative flavoprotein involved in K+ transport
VETRIETIIIGGGQAGLSTSYYLKQLGSEHIVLEQAAEAGNAWRNDRWDSFTLLTPNWSFRLPGAEYNGKNPDGFMLKEEIVERFEKYTKIIEPLIQFQQRVTSVEQDIEHKGYIVTLEGSQIRSRNVVVATGLYQKPKIPFYGKNLPANITHIHSGKYRNPGALPPGAVLVVGSAQSGCQIVEELYQSGRKVYQCIGSTGRVPRRYRGKDIYEWMLQSGYLDRTPDKLPSLKARFAGNPHVSGKDGGHTLNLHQFIRDGVTLLGRLQNIQGNSIFLSRDLSENLAKADQVEATIVQLVDEYIFRTGIDAPTDQLPVLHDGYAQKEITELNLDDAGISTIIWALGYDFDFSMVKLPVVDGDGFPIQQRGETNFQGLYFVGLPWLYKQKSGHLVGVAEDAAYIASQISTRHFDKRKVEAINLSSPEPAKPLKPGQD